MSTSTFYDDQASKYHGASNSSKEQPFLPPLMAVLRTHLRRTFIVVTFFFAEKNKNTTTVVRGKKTLLGYSWNSELMIYKKRILRNSKALKSSPKMSDGPKELLRRSVFRPPVPLRHRSRYIPRILKPAGFGKDNNM